MAVSIGPRIGIDGEKEYRNELKNIIQSTKTLDAQMKALESSFDDETDALEKNAKKTELLEKKKEKLAEEVEKMAEMVERSADATGEDSAETQKWQEQLAKAEVELNKVTDAIEEQAEELESLNSPMGELTQLISDQESELQALRDEYANAYIAYGEQSDVCQELASQIDTVSGSLAENVASMEEAQGAADNIGASMDTASQSVSGIGEAAEGALAQFAPSISGMVSNIQSMGLIDTIQTVVSAVGEIGTKILEAELQFQQSIGNMAAQTGLTGDELNSLNSVAVDTWAAFDDADLTLDDTTALMSALNTRFGLTTDDAHALGEEVLKFAQVTGVNAADAVNSITDMMKQWGMVTGDTKTDMDTVVTIMDELTEAGILCDANLSTLVDTLAQQAGAFQELGLSQEEALGMMVAFEDAGGSATDIAAGMYQALKNLQGKTEDIPGAFKEIVSVLENSNSVTEAMSTTIESAGITLEEAFGAKKAQTISNTFVNGGADMEKFTKKIETCRGKTDELRVYMVTTEDAMSTFGKTAQTVGHQIFQDLGGPIASIASQVSNLRGEYIRTEQYMSSHPLAVGTSGGSSGRRNAVGYSRAMVYDSPTIFGVSGGQNLIAGDRQGAEVVVGESHLMNMFTRAVYHALGSAGGNTTNNYGGASVNVNVYGAPGQDVKELANLVSKQINRQVNMRRAVG